MLRLSGHPQSLPRGRHPALFLAAWAVALALLIIAIQLQRQLWQGQNQSDLTSFWRLLAVGVAFAAVVGLGLRLPEPRHSEPPSGREAEPVSPGAPAHARQSDTWDAWTRLAAAAVCELAALWLFSREQRLTLAWLLHLFACALFLIGVWGVARTDRRALAGSWSRLDSALALGLVLIALVPRVWQLGSVPQGIWFDEAQRGLETLRIMAEPQYRPVFASSVLQEPTAYWYLMVPLLLALGRDALALRVPAAIIGALGIGAVYLLGRVLFDRRTAFVAAGLMVGLVWHLNFSRVAFPAIGSVTFDALAAALFALALRRRSALPFAAAGLAAGAGLYFYYASELLPLILAAVALHRLVSDRLCFVRTCGPGLVVCTLGFFLAAGPFVEYSLLHQKEFSQRTATVSIFKEVEQAGSWQPLIDNVKAHLLMFNLRGDPNGRHNWSGHPMLDDVSGALAVLGLALVLTRCWRWEYALPLAWLPVSLAGGVLSLSFEAPQSHRAIDAITASVLLAALPLGALWRASDLLPEALARLGRRLLRTDRPAPERPTHAFGMAASAMVFGGAAVGLVIAANVVDVQRYYSQQLRDKRTWIEYTTPQTEAGREINDLPLNWKIYLPQDYVGHPTINFLVRQPRQYAPFNPATNLPVTDEGAAIFLSGGQASFAARVAELYPNAQKRLARPPGGGEVALYSFMLSPADVQASQGVVAHYGEPAGAVEQREARLDFAWPAGAPLAPPFAASFQTTLSAPAYGTYRLKLEGPTDAGLVLDGLPVLTGGSETELTLASGSHALRLEVPEAGQAPLRLLWAPPDGRLEPLPARVLHVPPVWTTGLLARLYRGPEPSGQPAIQRVDPSVELQVHLLPLERPYTIEWSGAVRAGRAGVYRFGTDSRDTSAVWIDGRQVVANTTPGTYADGTVTLSAGWHDLRVRFLDSSNFTHIQLYWQPPGQEREVIPSQALRPWAVDRIAAAQPVDASLTAGPPAPPPPPAAALAEAPTGQPEAPPSPAEAPIAQPEASAPPPPQPDLVLQPASEPATGRALAAASALAQPRGAAMGADGTVYVADAGRKAVIALPTNGGAPRTLAEGQLGEPAAVALLPDGNLVVVDAAASALYRLSADGRLGERLVPEQAMYNPRGVGAAADGRLAVADTGNNRLLLLPPDGAAQSIGDLLQPTDAAFLPDGSLLVAETGADQLTIVKPDGQRVASWTMPHANTVVGPHVAVLPGGGWVVTAPDMRSVLRMPPNGRSLEIWAAEPDWRKPTGLAAGPTGVVVTDGEVATAVLLDSP